jgi:hypothetical protein
MPPLPKNFVTWLMILLLLVLAGMAGWMYWALTRVEEHREGASRGFAVQHYEGRAASGGARCLSSTLRTVPVSSPTS